MNSNLSLFMIYSITIVNIVSSDNNPCLNFPDGINFKLNFTVYARNISINTYTIQFNNISHENLALV
jgi:hypothetical protein